MRKSKRTIALLLSLILVLSSLTGLVSAEGRPRGGESHTPARTGENVPLPRTGETKGLPLKNQGAKVHVTLLNGPVDPEEQVKAIVLMEGPAPAELPQAQRRAAALMIAKQHRSLRSSMAAAGVDYKEAFAYNTLLNGMALTVAWKDLDTIAGLPGVAAVHVANHYDPPEVVRMESSNEMTGVSYFQNLGWKGSGTVIAVLDTGITYEHEAFQAYEGMLKTPAITQTAAEEFIQAAEYGRYESLKIPFSYDYADQDDDATDDTSGHGTHVSGIALGYAQTEDGGASFIGTAPDAQLLAMKIFASGSAGTDSTIYFKAIEDAYNLGADVISMSIGAQNGFTYDTELENEVFGNIYQTMADNGVAMVIAAGNEGSMADGGSNWAGQGFVTADYADYGVVGSPSTYGENISVASAENQRYPVHVLSAGGRNDIRFYDSFEPTFFDAFSEAGEVEFAVVPGYGEYSDYEGLAVEGRIALVSRGEISFQEKLYAAYDAGAMGLLVYNNEPGVIYMSIEDNWIPSATISQEDGEFLKSLAETQESQEPGEAVFQRVGFMEDLRLDEPLLLVSEAGMDYPVALNGALGSDEIGTKDNFVGESADDLEMGYISADVETMAATFTYDGGSLRNQDDLLLTCEENDDSIYLSESAEDLTLTIDQEGKAQVETNGNTLAFDPSWPGFRFFTPTSGVVTRDDSWVAVYQLFQPVPAKATDVGLVSIAREDLIYENPQGWQISTFSSMGVTPDLKLKPWITGIGGNVISAAFQSENGYVNYSGTSMATPNVSGAMALTMEYLTKTMPDLEPGSRAKLAESLLESKARILTNEDGVPYSPRRQGAGLIDFLSITEAKAYVDRPVFSLGESADGSFTLTFTIHNLTDQELCYAPSVTALKDMLLYAEMELDDGTGFTGYYNTTQAEALEEGMLKLREKGTVNVPAQGQREVTLHLQASDQLLEQLSVLENGGFVDGFLNLEESEFICGGKPGCPGDNFTDMPKLSNWAHAGLDFAIRRGLLRGTSNTTIAPNGDVTRGMLVTILYRLAGEPSVSAPIPFEDVPNSKYYTKAVRWAAENGIVNGTTPTTFSPEDNVTREQLATILYRYAEFIGLDVSNIASLDDFPDKGDIHKWGRKAMGWAVGAGIITGSKVGSQTYLEPNGKASRAQVATMLQRFCALYEPLLENPDHLHLAFTGFVGDWTKAPILESHDWRETVELENYLASTPADEEGNTYADYGYTYRDLVNFEVNTDVNRVYACSEIILWFFNQVYGGAAGDNLFGYAPFKEEHVAFSPYGLADCLYIAPMALRNARTMALVMTDAETGELLDVYRDSYLPKAIWDPDYQTWYSGTGWIYDGYMGDDEETGESVYLPNNTKINFQLYASLDYGEDGLDALEDEEIRTLGQDYLVWSFSGTLDSEAPELQELVYDPAAKTLSVTASDNQYLAAIGLTPVVKEQEGEGNDTPEDLVRLEVYSDDEKGQSHTFSTEELQPGEYVLDVMDYATNAFEISLVLGDSAEFRNLHLSFPASDSGSYSLDGPTQYLVSSGASVTLPELEIYDDNVRLAGWTDQAVPEALTQEEVDALAAEGHLWLPGEAYSVTEDTTLYALLGHVSDWSDPASLLWNYIGDPASYEGTWAFGAFNYDDYQGHYFLNSQGRAQPAEVTLDQQEGRFYLENAPEGILFDVAYTEAEEGYGYTLQNRENGRYLAVKNQQIAYVEDPLDPDAAWDINYDDYAGSTELNNVSSNLILVFDMFADEMILSTYGDVDVETQWMSVFGVVPTGYVYTTEE